MAKHTPKKRLPKVDWLFVGHLPSGSQYWQTRDGMLRLVASNTCDGIALPLVWKLYQWRGGSWWPAAESRSRETIEKIARQRAAELDADE